jgi:Trk K+ transport system NAD-binding subunit
MNQPVILCGLGQVGRRVLAHLHAAGVPVVVIDTRSTAEDLKLDNVRVIRGDCRVRETLREAGLDRARGVLILTSDDLVNISAALLVRHLDPNVRIVVRLFNQNLIPRLGKAVANAHALSVSHLTAPLLALTALTGQALGTFGVDGARRQIAETTVGPGPPLRGLRLGTAATSHGVQPIAHYPAAGGERLLLDVDADATLETGDRLVVCGDPRALEPLLEGAGAEALPHLRWAGWLRRNGRVLWHTLAEVDLAVKVCTALLVFTVVGSTLVYRYATHRSLATSLLRTIGLVATGGDLHEGELTEDWQKVFVSFLRLAGAALVAAFTAIFTNYLLRARLRGALEVRRIPDSGHVIVCGLGNVGFRVVEELVRHGERVVVIEAQRDGRFMAAARRSKAAVIVGDATVLEVLRQAHAATARAVVAATNHELVNIEIALLARELNPRQRVVVRLNDPQLSDMLREAANIRLALSLPSLAAPAFIAALFGDRVLTVFLVGRHLMTALELVVPAEDASLVGQPVQALAVDYRMLPVRLCAADGVARPRPLEHRLGPGDRLTALLELPDLARLLRRERGPADCSVEVSEFPLQARPVVVRLLRERRGFGPDEAEKALATLPLCAAAGLTRGQAESLRSGLLRDGIDARVVSAK